MICICFKEKKLIVVYYAPLIDQSSYELMSVHLSVYVDWTKSLFLSSHSSAKDYYYYHHSKCNNNLLYLLKLMLFNVLDTLVHNSSLIEWFFLRSLNLKRVFLILFAYLLIPKHCLFKWIVYILHDSV